MWVVLIDGNLMIMCLCYVLFLSVLVLLCVMKWVLNFVKVIGVIV